MKKNNRFLSFTAFALLAFVPFSVDALVFKNGEDVISFSERDVSCVDERFTDGYRVVGSLEDAFVFSNDYNEDYVKVTVEGKCEELTLEEILSFRKPHVSYSLNQDGDKYFLMEDSTTFYENYYIKTTDTEIDSNKTYYTMVNGYRALPVTEPKTEELSEYYESFYFKHYDNKEIDATLTYFKRVGDTIEVQKVEEDNVNASDIQYYYVEVSDSQVDISNKVQEVSKKAYDLVGSVHSVTKNPETGEFYIEIYEYEDVLDETIDKVSIYDIDGNLLYKDIESFMPLHNSLYFVQKLEENQGDDSWWSFDVYDSIGASSNLLTTINDIRFVSEKGYANHNSLLYGYTYDEDSDEELDKYYDLRVYKIIEEASSVYNGNNDIVIKASGNVKNVDKIYVNGEALETDNFILESGSIILTLKKEYLNTLENDTYDLKITYKDGGYVETTFEVEKTNSDIGSFKLTFDANGGVFKDDKTSMLFEEWNFKMLDTQEQPTREGYKFVGWYTEKEEGIPLASEPTITDDMTFYAHWEEDIEPPKTFDGVTNSIIMGTISLFGLVGAALYLKRQNEIRVK